MECRTSTFGRPWWWERVYDTKDVITIDALKLFEKVVFCEAFLSSRRKYRGTSMFETVVSKPLAHLNFLSGVNCYDISSRVKEGKRGKLSESDSILNATVCNLPYFNALQFCCLKYWGVHTYLLPIGAWGCDLGTVRVWERVMVLGVSPTLL